MQEVFKLNATVKQKQEQNQVKSYTGEIGGLTISNEYVVKGGIRGERLVYVLEHVCLAFFSVKINSQKQKK